ncbi:hypothetical protein BRADI_2g01330v3 [Brachypodium distachyon]|nr:hypothetical protein BRADI_2g01330v3 [Brachypodium distachyon]
MFLFLIGDDPEKKPYNKAAKALLSDIEYGCLPHDILHGISCKFRNGTVLCEVRDYRTFLSKGDDSSEYDFPKMNRVALKLGTECAIKDLSLIADSSWTYHDQLIAESTIINALQPRLNLDPTPCIEKLYNSAVKKIDLGLNKGRQQTRATSLLNTSINHPEKCKRKEWDACDGAALCIDNSDIEILPIGIYSSPVNCPSSPQVNNAKSTVMSDPENTAQRSSTVMNSPALCGRIQGASSSTARGNFLQSHEHRVEVAAVQVDHRNEQSLRETVLSQKRKESSSLPCERKTSNKSPRLSSRSSSGHFEKSIGTLNKEGLKLGSPKELPVEVKVGHIIGNKDMIVHPQKPFSVISTSHPLASLDKKNPCLEKSSEKQGSQEELPVEVKVHQIMGEKDMAGYEQKPISMIPTNHPLPSLNRNNPCLEKATEKAKLGSQQELQAEVKIDQKIGKKDMGGQKNEPFSVLPTNRLRPSLDINSLRAEKISEKVHSSASSQIRMNEIHLVSIVDLENHGVVELGGGATTSVTSCSASSRKAASEPHKASKEPQPTGSERKVSGTCTISLNEQTDFEEKRQKKADIQVTRPCKDGNSVEPGVTDGASSQLGISPDIELCIEHPLCTMEPDIEKILSEVIVTTQRHGLNGNAAKIDDMEKMRQLSSCSPSHLFRYGSAQGSSDAREEITSCYRTGRPKSIRNVRRFVFHRVQYFCKGIVDESHYILCLLESESLDDHQITVETIFGHEHIHIATLPTYDQANKFVDQFILLMKRDGYTLCNAPVCIGFSDLRQQSEDNSHLSYLSGEYPQYQGFSPCVAKSVVINESKDTGFTFQKRPPDEHANHLQQGNQQWGLPGAHANVLQQGLQQWGLPDVHANVVQQGSQQWGLPDVHPNAPQQGSQQWGLQDVHPNAPQQGSQQWGPPDVRPNAPPQGSQQRGPPDVCPNAPQQGTQQWGLPDVHPNVPCQGSQQSWLPDVHANVMHQGSQQWRWLANVYANVMHQGSSQQWGQPNVHANVMHQGISHQWGLPGVHANVVHQGNQQWSLPDMHANALHQGQGCSQQWAPPVQSQTLARANAFQHLNPSHPVEQQCNSRVLQDQRLSFATGAYSMGQGQHLHVQPSQEVGMGMDQHFQRRHLIPGFCERYATSTGNYGQWHQAPPQLDGRMQQWALQDFGRLISSLPPMHAGRSMMSSAPQQHPAGGPQMSLSATGSGYGSLTSTQFHHSLAPPGYQHPSHGIC